jgi:hypothetical protein
MKNTPIRWNRDYLSLLAVADVFTPARLLNKLNRLSKIIKALDCASSNL